MLQPLRRQSDPVVEGDLVSILIPAFNEEKSIVQCYEEISEVLQSWGRPYEIVIVDDGSRDSTPKLLHQISQSDERVTVVYLRTNFGQTAALTAAMDHACGSVFVPIDADLQNDPRDIPMLVDKLDEGYDVVSGWRKDRKDKSLSRVLPSRCANWLISRVSGVKLHDYGCSLTAYRREVLENVRLYGEMHRFIPIYARMNGGEIAEVVVNHRSREHGESKYGLERTWKVLLDLFVVKFFLSYAAKPIYIFGGFGLMCLASSIIPVALAVFYKLSTGPLHKDFVETPLLLIAATLGLVGLLAILQGLLAEVLIRTYFESQSRRPYSVKSISKDGAAETV